MLMIIGLMGALACAPAQGRGPDTLTLVQTEAPVEERLWELLQLSELMPVLREESLREARRMEAEGLIEGAGPPWSETVARIHEPARMRALFLDGVRPALQRAEPGLLARAMAFHASPLGQRVLRLETSARLAMLDEDLDADARATAFLTRDTPRGRQIADLIRAADLIGPNVAGGMNAVIGFSRGFAEGGGYAMPPDPREIVADAWAQRDQIEAETTEWLHAFLTLAYGPLSDDELRAYTEFAASAEGRLLSRLLFSGFDALFGQTAFDMGLAAALRVEGQQL